MAWYSAGKGLVRRRGPVLGRHEDGAVLEGAGVAEGKLALEGHRDGLGIGATVAAGHACEASRVLGQRGRERELVWADLADDLLRLLVLAARVEEDRFRPALAASKRQRREAGVAARAGAFHGPDAELGRIEMLRLFRARICDGEVEVQDGAGLGALVGERDRHL